MKLFSQTKLINLLLITGMIVLAFCGVLAHKQVRKIHLANDLVVHTHTVIDTSNMMLLALTEGESRVNYYLATRDKSILNDVPNFISLSKQKLNQLIDLTKDNVIQNTRAAELEKIFSERIDIMQKLLQTKESDVDSLVSSSAIKKREKLKINITSKIADINQEEINLLGQRNEKALHEINMGNLILDISILISELLMILSFFLINYTLYRRKIAEHKRRKAEKEIVLANENLKESEERYLLATEASSAGLWDWGVGTSVVFYSPLFKQMLGYSDEDFPNSLQSFEKIIHPQDHNQLWENINKHLKDHVPFKTEYRLRKKSGTYNWFQAAGKAIWNESGVPTRMVGSIIDVQARKMAEQSLSIQYAIAEILSEGISLEGIALKIIKTICEELRWEFSALWEVNKKENRLQCVNAWHGSSYLKIFEDETRKMHCPYDVGLPGLVWKTGRAIWFSDVLKEKKFLRAALAEKVGLRSAFAFPIHIKEDVLGVIECYTTEKELPDKNTLNLMNIIGEQIGDFLSRKQVEKIKNEFVSVVSHELRTPLTSISGVLSLVLGGAGGAVTEKTTKLLDLANNNCNRLLALINDILDVEKLAAGKMNFHFKVVDIEKVVNEALLANQMYARKFDVTLVLTESVTGLKVNVDPDRLMQVLANLISNAVKFSPKNEKVTIAIKQHQNTVTVSVSNKGPGIPLEFQPRIFQKFSQADSSTIRSKGGTGLGLNISKTMIEKLGGTLNFVSKPDEITTFYFDLPLWENTKEIIRDQKSKTVKDKILVCEDDEDQASYLANLLEAAGFFVDVSHNTSEAKQLLANDTYHVLLLDLILPGQDGISFIRELRSQEKTRHIPIIVLSMIANTGKNVLNGEAFSVVDWLDKPVDFDKLLRTIKDIKNNIHPHIPKVLHVEDDPITLKYVETLLKDDATVVPAMTIKETIEKLKNMKFDLVILDLVLPDGNAEQILPFITEYKLPIIVFSTNALDKNLEKSVNQVLLKSEYSNEKFVDLIKHVLHKEREK